MRNGIMVALALCATQAGAQTAQEHERHERYDRTDIARGRVAAGDYGSPRPDLLHRPGIVAGVVPALLDTLGTAMLPADPALPDSPGISPIRRTPQPRLGLYVATAGGEPGLSLNYAIPLDRRSKFFAVILTTGKQSMALMGFGHRW